MHKTKEEDLKTKVETVGKTLLRISKKNRLN